MGDQDIASFQTAIRGPVIRPCDPNYDEVRKLYNRMIDKRPQLIVRCTDAADVVAAVNYGREKGLRIAIRGGGHNGAGIWQRRRWVGD
jgi:hypothetical protein